MKNKFSIDIDNSINSGQVFLWEKDGTDWYGINGQDILKINKNGVIKSIINSKTDFFRKNDNMEEIIRMLRGFKNRFGSTSEIGSVTAFDTVTVIPTGKDQLPDNSQYGRNY